MKQGSIGDKLREYFSEKIPSFYRVVKETGIRAERYAWPFLPYVGEAFPEGSGPRILFVGKATGAWADNWKGQDYGNLKECMERNIGASELLELTKRVVL